MTHSCYGTDAVKHSSTAGVIWKDAPRTPGNKFKCCVLPRAPNTSCMWSNKRIVSEALLGQWVVTEIE